MNLYANNMKSVLVLCVVPLLCWAGNSEQQPKVNLPQPSPHVPHDVQIGGYDVTVCTHEHARNLAVMLIFTDKTKATQAFCPNEHVVTIISSKNHEKDAKDILIAAVEESHKFGGGARRLTLVGEGVAAQIVWTLLQDPSTHDLYHNVLFYDVIPGLYHVDSNLDSFPSKKNVVFGLTSQEPLFHDNEEVIRHAADFLAHGDDRLLKTLTHFYGKRAVGTVVQDVTLFHGVRSGLARMMENEGHVFIYEGGKHEEKLTEALVMLALTGNPGFLSTGTAWPRFEPHGERMYLDLTGTEATFQEGWRHKNGMLWDMINPTLPQKPRQNN